MRLPVSPSVLSVVLSMHDAARWNDSCPTCDRRASCCTRCTADDRTDGAGDRGACESADPRTADPFLRCIATSEREC